MPDAPTPGPSSGAFIEALLIGLGWGIVAAITIVAASIFVLPGTPTLGVTLEIVIWSALIASYLAIFPIAPIAGVTGWLLYRRGIVAPLAYAVVGTLSAVLALALVVFLLVGTMGYEQRPENYEVLGDNAAHLVLSFAAVAGAFGGFMGGRALQRSAQP